MEWTGKNVLVTGATGLLGGHLVEELAARKAAVVAIVRDDVPDCYLKAEGLDRRIRIVRGSIEDYSLVERTMNEYEAEACFHLGAQTIVGTANRSPLSTFEANIKGTWNVLEAARNSSLMKATLVASTDKVYGESGFSGSQGNQSDHPARGIRRNRWPEWLGEIHAHADTGTSRPAHLRQLSHTGSGRAPVFR